jgi:PAS domain S-box-containing protein
VYTLSVEIWQAILISTIVLFTIALILVHKRYFSAQRETQKDFSEKEQNYINLLNRAADIIYTHSLDGSFIQINKAVTKLLGYNIGDVIGKPFKNLISPGYEKEWDIYLQYIIEKKETKGLLHLSNINSEVFTFEYHNSLIEKDSAATAVQGIARNVTEQIKTAQETASNEKRYKLLFNMLPYGGLILDANKYIIECSNSIEQLLGYKSEELTGKPVTVILDQNSVNEFFIKFEELKTGSQALVEAYMIHKNGNKLDVLTAGQTVFDNQGHFIGILFININISGLKTSWREKGDLKTKEIEDLGALSGYAVHETADKSKKDKEKIKGETGHLLVVDDEEPFLKMVKKYLSRFGYDVIVTDNCIDAIDIFKNQGEKIDVVVTDMIMPEMTGLELAKELKCIRPDIQIILLSGDSNVLISERQERESVFAYLEKPIDPADLMRVVQKAVQMTAVD